MATKRPTSMGKLGRALLRASTGKARGARDGARKSPVGQTEENSRFEGLCLYGSTAELHYCNGAARFAER